MKLTYPTYDELDEILFGADDPQPEGKEKLTEIDLDSIREEYEENER